MHSYVCTYVSKDRRGPHRDPNQIVVRTPQKEAPIYRNSQEALSRATLESAGVCIYIYIYIHIYIQIHIYIYVYIYIHIYA